ncbi:hypothetical protein [Amycolatopsis sp. H20-H5]|uniref:hypothetical protein n=1 Tax=Amycolatopsis sp. H20-H5 TaxID=3046309 RepID=UPI002DB933AC|nr:hypothetical protein [Amycolatopsis sp. H20-H5]MEC3977161.1 hypothetical protein [Amycolatopsis sp. H20-H5]
MGNRAVAFALLCICGLTACSADAGDTAAPTDGLSATFRWNGTLALREPLQAGEKPPPDADCAAALQWAIDTHHAEPFENGTLAVDVSTSRVLQVNKSMIGVHEVRQYQEPGWDYEFSCPNADTPINFADSRTFDLGGNECLAPMRCRAALEDNSDESEITMIPGEPRHVDLALSKMGVEDIEYVVDFDAIVNNVHVSRSLNPGGKTFKLHDWPYKQGALPGTYTWTPGTPGSLTFAPPVGAEQ